LLENNCPAARGRFSHRNYAIHRLARISLDNPSPLDSHPVFCSSLFAAPRASPCQSPRTQVIVILGTCVCASLLRGGIAGLYIDAQQGSLVCSKRVAV
jgi:hypothetical protein